MPLADVWIVYAYGSGCLSAVTSLLFVVGSHSSQTKPHYCHETGETSPIEICLTSCASAILLIFFVCQVIFFIIIKCYFFVKLLIINFHYTVCISSERCYSK